MYIRTASVQVLGMTWEGHEAGTGREFTAPAADTAAAKERVRKSLRAVRLIFRANRSGGNLAVAAGNCMQHKFWCSATVRQIS